MVMRYAHPSLEHQARAIEKLEGFTAEQRIEAAAHKSGASPVRVK